MNLKRYVLATAAALLLGLAAIPIIRACAPEGPSLAFTWATHPDFPLNAFTEGRLGILQPTYARSYLVVAYRQLTGVPLTQAERRSVLELWDFRLQGGVILPKATNGPSPKAATQTPAGGATSDTLDWKAIRARFTRETAPEPVRFRWEEDFYREEVSDSALEVAASTLLDRSKRWKSDMVVDWIRAQDKVFSTNGKTKLVPEPARANQDGLFQKDRAYQIACAQFYIGDFAAARTAFNAIAQDAASMHLLQDKLLLQAAKSRDSKPFDGLMERRQRRIGQLLHKPGKGRKCPRVVKAKPKKYEERWVRASESPPARTSA